MKTAQLDDKSDLQFETKKVKTPFLVIGHEELTNIFVANKLNQVYGQKVLTESNLDAALDTLTKNSIQLLVLDIDNLENEAIERIYRLINHLEIPCLITASNPDFLNKLRLELDQTFLSFLPKSILKSMLTETLTLLFEKCGVTKKVTNRIISTGHLPKTKSLYFVAGFLFLEPIIKVLYLKFLTGFEWDILLRTIFSIEGVFKNFEFWGIFPLAGYALISVRSWSFLFFISLQVYVGYTFFAYEKFTWPYVAQNPHISSTLLLACNLAIILYFLTPAHLRPYWNETRKMWRNTSRFATSIQAFFKHHNKDINTTITNLSETGAYFTSKVQINVGDKIELEIPLGSETKKITATVKRTQPTADQEYTGYGVEFNYKSSQDKKDIREYINSLNHRLQ